MRISESRLSSVIRAVINESDDYRLSVEFGMNVQGMIDEFKEVFVNSCIRSRTLSEDALMKLKDDWFVDSFLKKYLTEVIHLNGEHTARRHFSGTCYEPRRAFKNYVER